MAPGGRSGGGSENSSKNEAKKHTKKDDFGEASASKMMLPCRRREHFAKKGRHGNDHQKCAKWEPKWLPKWSQKGSLGGPWAKLCDFGGFRGEAVFLIFLIGETSADKSLQIRPRSSRGAPRNARLQKALPEPVPRRGEGGR